MKVVPLAGRGFDCNVFLVKCRGNRYDLVDAGIGNDHEHVLRQVQAVTDPTRIGTVAVTHEHLDHVNGLPAWQGLGARVATSAPCADKLRAGHDPTSAMFGHDIPRLDPDIVLQDEDHITLGDRDHVALWTPGHSPGSMCYWDADGGVLFSGDTVFAEGGIGRFDFPDGDVRRLAESILRLEKLPARMLHCGHGPSVEGDAAKRSLHGSLQHVRQCLV